MSPTDEFIDALSNLSLGQEFTDPDPFEEPELCPANPPFEAGRRAGLLFGLELIQKELVGAQDAASRYGANTWTIQVMLRLLEQSFEEELRDEQ